MDDIIGKPIIIDVAGTIEAFVKWALLQIVYLITAFILMALAPLLYTVGAGYVVITYPGFIPTFAVIYLLCGPWFCAAWMSPISHWNDWVLDWKARKSGRRYYNPKGRLYTFSRGVSYMFGGLFASYVIEGLFTYVAHLLGLIPNHPMLYFAIAPFAVFAPCWLVVLSRWIRRNEYATA